jgi:hypothetical protein
VKVGPVAHVPEAKAASWSEALILAQSDVPTTGALNLMMKWVVAEGKSDAIAVCCTCILQNCVVSTGFIRVKRCLLFLLLRFRLAYSIMFTEPSRLICIRVFDFYLLQTDSLFTRLCARILVLYWWQT